MIVYDDRMMVSYYDEYDSNPPGRGMLVFLVFLFTSKKL